MSLSPRERAALAFIQSRSNPRPSLGEIANAIGVSQSGAAYLLRVLAQKGWVAREAGKHRALVAVSG